MPPRRAAMWALGAYLLALGLIALWPVPVDQGASDFLMRSLRQLHRWGVPPWFNYGVVELTSNVILFLPLGALVTRILGARLWWGGVAVGFLLSVLVELAQLVFLPARFPSVIDVAANTFGAMVGALSALLLMARHETV
ncbi:VanZ family protein [Arthrobacter sp. ok362]|uniref:VanZ family protein n=1 Tax=Arthrobacter sp. ok362 TaxID=1761745 RepID=UPI0011135893|nr:VanZ family protein [Arthrobacter sp. ok362]